MSCWSKVPPQPIPHAVRFARRLAEASNGVLLNPQTGQLWHRGKLRAAPAVRPGVVSTVEVRWYAPHLADVENATEAWLTATRRHLPEALPRRFGTREPFRHRLEDSDDRAFVDFVAGAGVMVFFQPAGLPAVSGWLATGRVVHGNTDSFGLTLLAEPLRIAAWRDALQGLFTDFARRVDSIVATAEVVRGVHWSGRSLGYSGDTERSIHLTRNGAWSGLPFYPPWWVWFGRDYAPLVREHLPEEQMQEHEGALFHWRSHEVVDRDQLLEGNTPPASWLPDELLAVEDRSEPNVWNPPLTAARVMPATLR